MKNVTNLVAMMIAFVVTFAVSFFLSPFIVRTLGVEANGLIGLSTNFLNYASVLTIILSSMSARFVTVELRAQDERAAEEYYTASYVSNLLGAVILLPVMVFTVVNFGEWFNVPPHLVTDAQRLSALLFMNFLLTLILPRWSVATWATNNLHLDSLRTTESVVIRGGLIWGLFILFEPAVSYVGIATLAAGIFTLAFRGYYKHRLLPGLRVRAASLRWTRLWDLLQAGFWNSVGYIGNLLMTGFHLLLANLFLGATATGLLALAMTVPSMVNQLAQNLSGVFLPSLAFAFADGDHTLMQRRTKRAMSVTALLTMMPLAALLAFGQLFFALWVPSADAAQLNVMSVVAAIGLVVACSAQPLQNVFVTTNSQRAHSAASLAMGVANVALALLLLNLTNWGIYAILVAAATTIPIRVLVITAPMAGRRVQARGSIFLPEIGRSIGYLAVLVSVGLLIRLVLPPTSWLGFILAVGAMCLVGSLINLVVLTERSDREFVLSLVRTHLPWKR